MCFFNNSIMFFFLVLKTFWVVLAEVVHKDFFFPWRTRLSRRVVVFFSSWGKWVCVCGSKFYSPSFLPWTHLCCCRAVPRLLLLDQGPPLWAEQSALRHCVLMNGGELSFEKHQLGYLFLSTVNKKWKGYISYLLNILFS